LGGIRLIEPGWHDNLRRHHAQGSGRGVAREDAALPWGLAARGHRGHLQRARYEANVESPP
jgi:hypothetical protein